MPDPAAQPGLILVLGAPRSGVSLLASQLGRHPSTQLVDAGPEGLVWLQAWLRDPAAPVPQEAMRDVYGGQGPPAQPGWLLLAAHGLLEEPALLAQLASVAAGRRIQAVWMQRRLEHSTASAARFPHLLPYLPDPFADLLGFEAAYAALWRSQQQTAQGLMAQLPLHTLHYEALVEQPEQELQQLIGRLGLPFVPLKPALRGISHSLCFRERPVDRAGIGVIDPADVLPEAPEPLVLATGRGGSGTRLLSDLLLDLGVDLGDRLNPMGDSIQWADLVYEISLGLLNGHARACRGEWAALLRQRAAVLGCGQRGPWGFKLPELMLILEPALEAWPQAKVLHLVRHPVDVCLRRTHMTSRLNNPIGRVVLAAGYQFLGLPSRPEDDEPWWHNAVSWRFQLERIVSLNKSRQSRVINTRYEELCVRPKRIADTLSRELGLVSKTIALAVDCDRQAAYQLADVKSQQVWRLCAATARKFGYQQI